MTSSEESKSITADDLIITEALAQRPLRAPDLAAENEALYELGRLLIETPETLQKHFVELAFKLCGAGSAGISLLERSEPGAEIFRWTALAGKFASYEGGFTPRDFSPCGICLDRGEPILLSNPGRLFTYFDQALPAIIEGLVLPLYGVGRRPIGTIWIVSHDAQHQFDQEDCRLMSRLADFSALAIERVAARKTLERNRAELTRIAQDNSLLAAIVASSGDAIIGEALSGMITSWNPGATCMFGYTAEEMIGKPLALMQVPGHDDDSLAILERIRAGERVHNYETIRRRKDGTILHVSLTLSPIYDAEGRLIGASKIARDITAARLAADALRQSEARLQDLQTDLLHVSRLSAMGQIAAMMAHELNQPLSAIANYVNAGRRLLTGGGAEKLEKLRDALERAAEQAMWAGQIIGGLRSFVTRAETKKQPEPVAEIVEEASRLALISARRHGVRIQLHLDSNSDLVLVDRIQIQQVLLNLMLNAVEAMGECDRREITISTRSKGQTIEVSVADTGPGLAPEISAQLFQPFVSTKRNGMGMGLAICRSIIDAHEGDLWSEPNPGEGTIFRFTLRAASVPSGCMVRAPEISSRGHAIGPSLDSL